MNKPERDLIDNGLSPSAPLADSPERAGKNAGTTKVERGSPGVPLTWIERQRLKRTIPIYDHEIDDVPLVIERLKRALKGEDERGRKHHWSYDANRHMGLMKFLRVYEGIRDDRQDDDPNSGLASVAREPAE